VDTQRIVAALARRFQRHLQHWPALIVGSRLGRWNETSLLASAEALRRAAYEEDLLPPSKGGIRAF